jgi:hypothetical protein
MLIHHLQKANEILQDLIETTLLDIEDIKQAKHSNIFSRTKIKEELVSSFEQYKSLIDNEIIKLVNQNPSASLEDVLNQSQQNELENLKTNLEMLHKKNRYLASMVIAVSEFYSSLVNKLIPTEQIGYESHKAKRASYLQIEG